MTNMRKISQPGQSSEADEQAIVMRWCALQQRRYPELESIYHIPNGGSRHPAEAANLKRQGVKSGVPDLHLPAAKGRYHGLYIEMKYGKNVISENQNACLKQLQSNGYFVAVCYGAEAAIATIRAYITLHPGADMPCQIEGKGYPVVKHK